MKNKTKNEIHKINYFNIREFIINKNVLEKMLIIL